MTFPNAYGANLNKGADFNTNDQHGFCADPEGSLEYGSGE